MATCNYIKHSGHSPLVHDILDGMNVRRKMGMAIVDEVIAESLLFPNNVPVGFSGGVHYRTFCQNEKTISVWRCSTPDCQGAQEMVAAERTVGNFGLEAVAMLNAEDIEFHHATGDEVVCGKPKSCGYAYAVNQVNQEVVDCVPSQEYQPGQQCGHGLADVVVNSTATMYLGITGQCTEMASNIAFLKCDAVPTDGDCVQDGGKVLCSEHSVVHEEIAANNCIRTLKDVQQKITCDGNGKIESANAYVGGVNCEGTLFPNPEFDAIDLQNTVCIEPAESTLPNPFGASRSAALSMKGWVLTALLTAATVTVFGM